MWIEKKTKSHYNSRVSLHEAPTKNLNYLRPCLEKSNSEQDVDRVTESLVDAQTTSVNVFFFKGKIGYGTICRKTVCRKLTQGQFAENYFSFGKLSFGKLSRIRFLLLRSVENRLNTSPSLIWGHIRCMHARPHRRKDQLPLRLLQWIESTNW